MYFSEHEVAAPNGAQTEVELLRRLQRGDNDAWAELTRAHSPRLYAYLRRNLPSAVDAEDALSETFLAAVRAMQSFDGKVTLSTFLYAIAYRKMADYWRRRPPTAELTESVPAASRDDHWAEFEELLNELPELSRQVLLLRYQVGLSVTEVAEVIDRSYKGTESLLSRARAQLRAVMERTSDRNE
jgi:RNA polymerase sigma-70 factor, ECF subfamily